MALYIVLVAILLGDHTSDAGEDRSANCSFTRGLCGWTIDGSKDSQFKWTRSKGTTFSLFTGPPGDRKDVCNTQRTEDNGCCVFPFVYNGRTYNSCTSMDASRPWCSKTSNYDDDKQWGLCDDECATWRTRAGRCCVFPLIYSESPDYHCIKETSTDFWCSLTADYFSDYKWDWCDGLGAYMYIEASGQNPGNRARLISPTMQGPQCMTFFYNMFGFDMGSIVIYTRKTSGKDDKIIWIKSGNQGPSWKRDRLSLNEREEYQVIIEGIRGAGYKSDAAIDDFTFTSGLCSDKGEGKTFYVSTRFTGSDRKQRVQSIPHHDYWAGEFSFQVKRSITKDGDIMNFVYGAAKGRTLVSSVAVLNGNSRLPLDYYVVGSNSSLEHFYIDSTDPKLYPEVSMTNQSRHCRSLNENTTTWKVYNLSSEVKVTGCFPGWHRVGDGCFRFHLNKYQNWENALKTCNEQEASLATITDTSTLKGLQKLIDQYGESSTRFFVGARGRLNGADWFWLDNSRLSSSAWGPGEPNGDGQCGAILRGGSWKKWALNDLGCHIEKGFICETPTANGKCSNGWRKILSRCYKFQTSARLTWAAARLGCQSLGGDLAVLNSSNIQDAIAWTLSNMSAYPTSIFVGFLRGKRWTWSGGNKFDGSGLWKAGFPKMLHIDSCAALTGEGLVDIQCDGRNQFICMQAPNHARSATSSSFMNDSSALSALDNSINTCFMSKKEYSPWWRTQLEHEEYVHEVSVWNSAENCDVEKSVVEISATVQRDTSLRKIKCGSAMAYGELSEYIFRCKMPIAGRFLTISLSGGTSQLILCLVKIKSLGTLKEAQGVYRDVWRKPLNHRYSVALRDNPYFLSPPSSSGVIPDFDTPVNYANNYGQRLVAYFQPPQTGNFTVFMACDDGCDLWIRKIREVGLDEKDEDNNEIELPVLRLRKWTGHLQWNKYPSKQMTTFFFHKCYLYELSSEMYEGGGGDHLSVGLKLPNGQFRRPIRKPYLFWLLPGLRSLKFKLKGAENSLTLYIGATLHLEASYRYCCEGIYCLDCPIKLFIEFLNHTFLVQKTLNTSCHEYVFEKNLEVHVSPSNYSIKIRHHIANESFPEYRSRNVGSILVKAHLIIECKFQSFCGWKTFSRENEGGWKLNSGNLYPPGSYAYLDEPLEVWLETSELPWIPTYEEFGFCLQFQYLLPEESGQASLTVLLKFADNQKVLWKLKGYHGDQWSSAQVSWAPSRTAKIAFQGSGTSNGSITVAIDDVQVTTQHCSILPAFAKPGYRCPHKDDFPCENGVCIKKRMRCDGDFNCKDKSDERKCKCVSNNFLCPTGECIIPRQLCDGRKDCNDGSDENNCGRNCLSDQFECVEGNCVSYGDTCKESGGACEDGTSNPTICGSGDCPLDDLTCKTEKEKEDHIKCKSSRGLCNFEDGLCGFSHGEDNFHWEARSAQTPSDGTGPEFDHSTLSQKGLYLFIEASQRQRGETARLVSGFLEPNETVCLQFWYHMYGSHTGNLSVIMSTNTTERLVWEQRGEQERAWMYGQTTLNEAARFRYIIQATVGGGNKGDIAIDDVAVVDGECEHIIAQDNPNCLFNYDTCQWKADESWTVKTNHESATGSGLLVLSRTLREGSYVVSPLLNGQEKCFRFWYFIKGGVAGYKPKLELYWNSTTGGENQIWSKSQETLQLCLIQIPLQAYKGIKQIYFKGEKYFDQQIAIEDVSFSEESCKEFLLAPNSMDITLPPYEPGCDRPLGMQSGNIPDQHIFASSFMNNQYAPHRGRLQRTGGWAARVSDRLQWLAVNLSSLHTITRVATQGSTVKDMWVKSYSLEYKKDSLQAWKPYRENGRTHTFTGNSDKNNLQINYLLSAIEAQYIKLIPIKWQYRISLRLELYGCSKDPISFKGESLETKCRIPIGIQSGWIPDTSITSSSQWDKDHAPFLARLHNSRKGNNRMIWAAKPNDKYQWLQVDLGKATEITMVATQGRVPYNQWVETYIVSYSQDGLLFQNYKEGNKTKLFDGNSEGLMPVTNLFKPAIYARYIRIKPQAWNNHISMRIELYTCTSEKKGSIQTKHLGCFTDASNRVIPILETVDPTLDGDYKLRRKPFLKCALAAVSRGFKVFGIENGGQCFSGPDAHKTYANYGSSQRCHGGYGGIWAIDIYAIAENCTAPRGWCHWEMTSKKTTTWKTSNYREDLETISRIQKFYSLPRNGSDSEDTINYEAELTLSGVISVSSFNRKSIGEFTICLWLQLLQSDYFEIVYMAADHNHELSGVKITIGQKIMLEVFEKSRTTTTSVVDGYWHHVCITWAKNGVYEVFKDGKLIGFGSGLYNEETQSIPGYGSMVANFNTTEDSKAQDVVIGKLSGLNMWNSVIAKQDIYRLSLGCGYEMGDLLQWRVLRYLVLGVAARVQSATCRHGESNYLSLKADSQKNESVAIFSSHWNSRASSSPLHCFKFRYLLYGPEAKSLEIFHKYKEGDDNLIWIVGDQTQNDVWRYAQVPVGALDEFQITVKGRVEGKLGYVAIGEPYISNYNCHRHPSTSKGVCNTTLTNSSGYITSPYYPGNSPSNFHCVWRIHLPQNHLVRLKILAFDLIEHPRCEFNFLQIRDGVQHSSPSLGRFCGHKFPTIVDSSSNKMEIEYKTNSRSPKSGFKILYFAQKNSEESDNAAICRRRRACPVGCMCSAIPSDNGTLLIQGNNLLQMPSKLSEETLAILFSRNRVASLKQKDFGTELALLKYLDLSSNRLFHIYDNPFRNLVSLEYLRLNRNFLKAIDSDVFTSLEKVQVLDLGVNLLGDLPADLLRHLSSLKVLSLRSNRISKLYPEMFNNTRDLTHLYLQENNIQAPKDGTFSTLTKLKVMYLNKNNIERLTKGSLQGLKSLEILRLEGNKISYLDPDAFKDLQNLKKLYLDEFIHCCYASAAVPGLQCDSPGNEFSSCDDLMKSKALRACLWVLGILAFLGNISVIFWRTTLGRENRVHSFLLTNLAASDLLMGIYLLIIAIKDAQWQGEYFKHDIEWRAGYVCQFAGALSMLSSEVSVIMLTLITMDRLICIVFPFSAMRLTWKKTYLSCGTIWLLGCLISCLPMTGMAYFADETSNAGFYGRSAVCLPLQLSEDKPAGWEYSVSFFLALNLLAFVFILVAYVIIFWTVKKSTGSIRSTKVNQDAAMARKLMFIILTDFCCWMPVIVIGILSLTGNFYDPEKKAYVIIAIFVLPVNSSINPLLYTFSNSNVRKAMSTKTASLSSHFMSMGDRSRRRLNNQFTTKSETTTCTLASSPAPAPRTKRFKLTKGFTTLGGKDSSSGYIHATTVSGRGAKRCLMKYYSKKDIEIWIQEVGIISKLGPACSTENILPYFWHGKAEHVHIDRTDFDQACLRKDSLLICFDAPDCNQTLGQYLNVTPPVVLDLSTVLAISLDLINAIVYLETLGIQHNNINADNVLIGTMDPNTIIPRVFLSNFSQSTNVISGELKQRTNPDVQQFGSFLDTLLTYCPESCDCDKIHDVVSMCLNNTIIYKGSAKSIQQKLENINTGIFDTRL